MLALNEQRLTKQRAFLELTLSIITIFQVKPHYVHSVLPEQRISCNRECHVN